MGFQGPCCSCSSCWQRCVSFPVVKSLVQSGSGFLVIPWSTPTSCDRDLKCLASVPFKIAPAVSQTRINQLSLDSCLHWVRSFLRLWRLSKKKDSVIIFSSDFAAGCEGPDTPSSTRQTDLVLYFLLWTGATAIGFGCLSGLTAA